MVKKTTPNHQTSVLVGANIQKFRRRQGRSPFKLSKLLDLTQKQVSEIENGTRRITIPQLMKVAEWLEIKPADLMKKGQTNKGGA